MSTVTVDRVPKPCLRPDAARATATLGTMKRGLLTLTLPEVAKVTLQVTVDRDVATVVTGAFPEREQMEKGAD